MIAGIDHLVILVSELEEAIADYEEQGFTVVQGGRHPTHTHNALIGLPDGSYLELLAFYEPYPESKWWSKVEQGGGLIAVCLQTDDLKREISVFRNAGMAMTDPTPLSRVRPDGFKLEWVLSVHDGDHPDLVPFLIEDETPRPERVPKETQHKNNVAGIATVTFIVEDLDQVKRTYSEALRQPGVDIERSDLHAPGARFRLGPHNLELVAPTGSTGRLRDWLTARGESPFSFELSTHNGEVFVPHITPTN